MVASAAKLKGKRTTAAKRVGSTEPRLWTPPLRELTPETSLGFAAVEFSRQVCGIDPFPWQEWLLIHMLELQPALTTSTMNQRGPLDPLFRFRKVIVLVARQNGKSTISQVLSLFFLYVLGVDLILGTAQDLDTAEEVWDGVLDVIEETPELAALADKPIKVNGKKTIRLKTGERYKVKAANRRAGRGLSGDLILLDEIREHQSFDAWAAITKTAQARAAAMIVALSNAGDASSVVLRSLRGSAHLALGDPDGINAEALAQIATDDATAAGEESDEDDPQSLGLFEWSAPPGCDVMDRDGWALANPSMGYGIGESTIAGDAATEGRKAETEWVFRTEVLCQWPDGALIGPFAGWDATRVELTEADADEFGNLRESSPWSFGDQKLDVCVDVSVDRSHAYIAACGEVWAPDQAGTYADRTAVRIVKTFVGVDGVRDWLLENRHHIRAVTGQARGAQVSDLISQWKADPRFTIPVEPWGGPDLIAAHGQADDALRDQTVWHVGQPVLDTAASLADTRDLGDSGWVINRRGSKCDVAPLMAWVGALWLHRRPRKAAPPPPAAALAVKATKTPSGARRAHEPAGTADLWSVSF